MTREVTATRIELGQHENTFTISALSFSRTDHPFFVGCEDGVVRCFVEDQQVWSYPLVARYGPVFIQHLILSPDARWLVAQGYEQAILFDCQTGEPVRGLSSFSSEPWLFAPRSHALACLHSQSVEVEALDAERTLHQFSPLNFKSLSSMIWPRSNTLLVLDQNSRIFSLDPWATDSACALQGTLSIAANHTFSPEGQHILLHGYAEASIYQTSGEKRVELQDVPSGAVYCFSPDGELLAALTHDGGRIAVRVWVVGEPKPFYRGRSPLTSEPIYLSETTYRAPSVAFAHCEDPYAYRLIVADGQELLSFDIQQPSRRSKPSSGKDRRPERSVVVLGASSHGKTALMRGLSKATKRKPEDGQLSFETDRMRWMMLQGDGSPALLPWMRAKATRAQMGLLVVDIEQGPSDITEQHMAIASELGLRLLVLLNIHTSSASMEEDRDRAERATRSCLSQAGFLGDDIRFVLVDLLKLRLGRASVWPLLQALEEEGLSAIANP